MVVDIGILGVDKVCQFVWVFYLQPIFEKRGEVLFWVPLLSPPTFCFISRLLL